MTISKKLLTTAALATFVAGASFVASDANAAKEGYEKCSGVVQAGQNDCAANGHSCAGQAKTDGGADEWVYLPQGSCDKIVGGKVVEG